MNDRETFERQIRADPADDTVRLVYADWLEEHGEPVRAEFIRVQVELAEHATPPEKAAAIRADRDAGLTYRQIAARHGVSLGAVHRVCNR